MDRIDTGGDADRADKLRIHQTAIAQAASHTVQIRYREAGEPRALGSGVLLEIGSALFLVSARHVFTSARGLGALSATGGLGVTHEIDLRKRRVVAADDPHDVCAVELTRKELSGWSKLRPVHLGDLGVTDDQHPDNWYLTFGFPERGFAIDPDARRVYSDGYVFGSHASTKPGVLARLDRNIHVTQEWYPGANERDGYADRCVRPEGMSGCGMWRVPRVVRLGEESPMRIDLIGIATETWEDEEVFVGTRIAHVVAIIRREYPSLRPAIDLVLPRSMRAR